MFSLAELYLQLPLVHLQTLSNIVIRNKVTVRLQCFKHFYTAIFLLEQSRMSPGANLGDVMRMLYMTVGRGSALYSPMEHRNMPGNNAIRVIRLSCRVQRN